MKYYIAIWKDLSDSTNVPSAQKIWVINVNCKEIESKSRILKGKSINFIPNLEFEKSSTKSSGYKFFI